MNVVVVVIAAVLVPVMVGVLRYKGTGLWPLCLMWALIGAMWCAWLVVKL